MNSPSKRHSKFDKASSDNNLNARVSENKQRRLSVTGSVIEPSIGDFGLIEVQETHQSPRLSFSQSLIIKDSEQLEDLVKRGSVLVKDDEVQQLSNELYPTLFNSHANTSVITESSSPLKVDDLDRDAQLAKLFYLNKLKTDDRPSASHIIKKVGIFNDESDEEEKQSSQVN